MMLRLLRWWLAVLGGVLIGGGLVLHGQVAVALYMREEVDSLFFLWRGIGKLTFMFQDEVTQAALTVSEVPKQVLVEADRLAWVLVVIGTVCVVTAPFVRRHKKVGAKQAKGSRR